MYNYTSALPPQPSNPFITSEGEAVGSRDEDEEKEREVYDPAFMLPLLSHMLDPGNNVHVCVSAVIGVQMDMGGWVGVGVGGCGWV